MARRLSAARIPRRTMSHGEPINYHLSMSRNDDHHVWPALPSTWDGYRKCGKATDPSVFRRLSAGVIQQAGPDASTDVLCGRLVVIGGTNSVANDFLQTPVGEMPGSMILANGARGLQISGGGLRQVPLPMQMLTLALVSFGITTSFTLSRQSACVLPNQARRQIGLGSGGAAAAPESGRAQFHRGLARAHHGHRVDVARPASWPLGLFIPVRRLDRRLLKRYRISPMRKLSRAAVIATLVALPATVAACPGVGVIVRIQGRPQDVVITRAGAPVARPRVLEVLCEGDSIRADNGAIVTLSLDGSPLLKVSGAAAYSVGARRGAPSLSGNAYRNVSNNVLPDMKRQPWDVRLRGPGRELSFAISNLAGGQQTLTAGMRDLLVRVDGGVGVYKVQLLRDGQVVAEISGASNNIVLPGLI